MNKNITAGTALVAAALICSGLFTCLFAGDSDPVSSIEPVVTFREKGFVPDESTAVKIAEAIWLPIYGKDIYELRPFRGQLQGDSVWFVSGTLPKGMDGGVPYAWILRKDCRVIGVGHEK